LVVHSRFVSKVIAQGAAGARLYAASGAPSSQQTNAASITVVSGSQGAILEAADYTSKCPFNIVVLRANTSFVLILSKHPKNT